MNHTASGAVSELLVAADLTARGWHVFRAVSPDGCCDLVALSHVDFRPLRVEVRRGKLEASGRITCSRAKKDIGRSDCYAMVLATGAIFYDPPLPQP